MRIILGNGKVGVEERAVGDFRSIGVKGFASVMVHKGSRRVSVSADSNILPYVTTAVVDGELRIELEPLTWVLRSTELAIDVSLPELAGIRLSGSSEAALDSFSGDSFLAVISGSSELTAALEFGTVAVKASGSSSLDLGLVAGKLSLRCSGSSASAIRGSAARADVAASGSSRIEARGFEVEDARIVASGSSRTEISVRRNLEAGLSGSSDLRCLGNPAVSRRLGGSSRLAIAAE
jgi:hypothetical protein